MTAMSSACSVGVRSVGDGQQKARDQRGLRTPYQSGSARSHGERRSAAAAARGVRVLEREAGLLEVALVVEGHAVQVLGAEAVDEAAHPCALEHDVVVGWLLLDAHAVAEPRAAAREHSDAEAGRIRRQ